MDNIRVGPIRNVAIVSNAGAGKTSLSEAILFTSGAVPVFGSITQGTTVSDFEPEELHHRSSVSTSVLQFSWNQTTISLLDHPGALSLLGEPLSALRAVDAALIVLDGQTDVRTELSPCGCASKNLVYPACSSSTDWIGTVRRSTTRWKSAGRNFIVFPFPWLSRSASALRWRA